MSILPILLDTELSWHSMVKLDEVRIQWIVKCKNDIKNEDIADVQTSIRIQQIYSFYKKNKILPVLKRPDCSSSPKISKTLLYESRCMTPFYTNLAKGKHEQQQT